MNNFKQLPEVLCHSMFRSAIIVQHFATRTLESELRPVIPGRHGTICGILCLAALILAPGG
jgi:hypothetical protein